MYVYVPILMFFPILETGNQLLHSLDGDHQHEKWFQI